jgi:hypothetical protein
MTLGPAAAADLAAFLRRLLHYDKRAVVRVQASGHVLAVYARPPFDVLALRVLALGDAADFDATVVAGDLLLGVEGASGEHVDVPAPVAAVAWAGVLPPRAGWAGVGTLDAAELVQAVRSGVAAFKAAVEAVPDEERTRSRVDSVAEQVWSRPLLGDLPLRAGHAARSLGFLPDRGEVRVFATGPWLRLDADFGSILLRRPGAPSGPALHLA